jgi:hypothetical protein
MSADDFKAQAAPQSIGATSIPSQETFGIATLANIRKVTISSGIISRAGFTTNTSFAVVNNLAIISGIASSENLLNNNIFGLNSYFLVPSISLLLRDAALTPPRIAHHQDLTQDGSISSAEIFQDPSLLSSINTTPDVINSAENFPSPNLNASSYISFSGNGISSLEELGTHTFSLNSYVSVNTSISSSESFQNNNTFGSIAGIALTSGIVSAFSLPNNLSFELLKFDQQITLRNGITSQLSFGPSITFYPPLTSYFGVIQGYTVVVNNILVTIERENILDTVTKIPRKIENLQTKSESLISFIETKNPLTSNIDIVYSIESEIVQDQTVIARQSKYYLESYIKPKYKISSSIYVEQNDNFYSAINGKIN